MVILPLFVFLAIFISTAHAQNSEDIDAYKRMIVQQIQETVPRLHKDNRTNFLSSCFDLKKPCTKNMFSSLPGFYRWRPGTTKYDQDRFWESYGCVIKLRLDLCPVDGAWSLWTTWSPCRSVCQDTGIKTRKRRCNNPLPKHLGHKCTGFNADTTTCYGMCLNTNRSSGLDVAKTHLEQIHQSAPTLRTECMLGECSYKILDEFLSEEQKDVYWADLICYKHRTACPVQGGWNDWGSWSDCTSECGNGYTYRFRECNNPTPANNGLPCEGDFYEKVNCVGKTCKGISADAKAAFSDWSDFSPCSVSCGSYGQQIAWRVCLLDNKCVLGDKIVSDMKIIRPCFEGPCPAIGSWTAWSEWTQCSAFCGHGRTTRLRVCANPYPAGGMSCTGPHIETQKCKGNKCAKTDWNTFALKYNNLNSMSTKTGQIKKTARNKRRRRQAPESLAEPVTVGRGDPYSTPYDSSKENIYVPWTQWTDCSHLCGEGYRVRMRLCKETIPECEGETSQIQFCNMFACPVSGGWGQWLAWSQCDATCGSGHRRRYRQCNYPLPKNGGTCAGPESDVIACALEACEDIGTKWEAWGLWSKCNTTCGTGSHTRTRNSKDGMGEDTVTEYCNLHPCPIDGKWSSWAEWSPCSALCGLGRHLRDRTCTDPAPRNQGTRCKGPGSESAFCYEQPCTKDEPVVLFKNNSFLLYRDRGSPIYYILLYLRVKPIVPHGTIFTRYRHCKESVKACYHYVNLHLKWWRPMLNMVVHGHQLNIQTHSKLFPNRWNDIEVGLWRNMIYIRLNDGPQVSSSFRTTPDWDLDFDAAMRIGASVNQTDGFVGGISILRVNYKDQSLYQSPYWLGPGAPHIQSGVELAAKSDTVNFPDFRNGHHTFLRFRHSRVLQLLMTLYLLEYNGFLVYNGGVADGAYVSLSVDRGALELCFACGVSGATCAKTYLLELNHWYYLTLTVDGSEADLRLAKSSAFQLSCSGQEYIPQKGIYVGGAPSDQWDLISSRAANTTQMFSGNIDTVVVNGKRFHFQRGGLYNSHGLLNSMGYTISAHVSQILEKRGSRVTLRCDFTTFTHRSHEAHAEWLLDDMVLETGNGVILEEKLPGLKNESALTLLPKEHSEGLYACVVNQEGRLVITHAFPVIHRVTPRVLHLSLEWTIVIILVGVLILIFISALSVFIMNRESLDSTAKSRLKEQTNFVDEDDDEDDEDTVYEAPTFDNTPWQNTKQDWGGQSKPIYDPTDYGEAEVLRHPHWQQQQANYAYGRRGYENPEAEEEEEEDLGNKEQDIGRAIAAKVIEDNRDKVLQLIANLGGLDSMTDASKKLVELEAFGSPVIAGAGQSWGYDRSRTYGAPSDIASDAAPSSPERRVISRRSSGSVSPSQKGPQNQSGSPRRLSSSISPLGPDASPPRIIPKGGSPVYTAAPYPGSPYGGAGSGSYHFESQAVSSGSPPLPPPPPPQQPPSPENQYSDQAAFLTQNETFM